MSEQTLAVKTPQEHFFLHRRRRVVGLIGLSGATAVSVLLIIVDFLMNDWSFTPRASDGESLTGTALLMLLGCALYAGYASAREVWFFVAYRMRRARFVKTPLEEKQSLYEASYLESAHALECRPKRPKDNEPKLFYGALLGLLIGLPVGLVASIIIGPDPTVEPSLLALLIQYGCLMWGALGAMLMGIYAIGFLDVWMEQRMYEKIHDETVVIRRQLHAEEIEPGALSIGADHKLGAVSLTRELTRD